MSRLQTDSLDSGGPHASATPAPMRHPSARVRALLRTEVYDLPAPANGVDPFVDAPTHADFDTWCRAHRGARVAIRVSAPWLNHWVAPGGLGRNESGDLERQARADFVHFFGEDARRWPLVASRDATLPIVIALPVTAVADLLAVAARHSVTIRAIQPAWVDALATLHRSTGDATCALVARESAHVTGIQWTKGRVTRIVGAAQADLAIDDYARVHGLQGRLHAVDVRPSDARPASTAFDFMARSDRPSRWAWALLALGLAAAGLALQRESVLEDRRSSLEASEHDLRARVDRLGRGSDRPRQTGRAQAGRMSQAGAAPGPDPYCHPWASLLAGIEEAARASAQAGGRGVSILSFAHGNDGRPGGPVTLEGVTADAASAYRFADALAAAGAFADARVVFHGLAAQAAGGVNLRFTVDAWLRPSEVACGALGAAPQEVR